MKETKTNIEIQRESSTGSRSAGTVHAGPLRKAFHFFLVGLFLITIVNSSFAQTVTVTGTVSELSGAPIQGANVVVKGNPYIGVITGNDGTFILQKVPADGVLTFSFIGYKTVDVPVGGKTRIDVQLEEDIMSFPEIVVNAGYYSVKEKESTGSISRITSKEIENQPVSNALASIQGQMAGVNITQNSGMPGGGFSVQIRGINSLRREGNYPMYIIDGVPVSAETPSTLAGITYQDGEINLLNAINPNDIESIEVLKDADATAIYGSRGANGVILITTKRGKVGDKSHFSINSSYGLSNVASKMKLMNTGQYLGMRRQAFVNDGITSYPDYAYDINGTWDQTRYTDWQKELIGNTATNSAVQISLDGGSDNTSFLVNGSHNEQTTVFGENFRYRIDNLSGTLNHQSADKKFSINATGLFSVQSNNVIQTDITSKVLILSPDAPALYDEKGGLNWENNTFDNPVALYVCTYAYNNRTLNTDVNLQYELFHNIHIKLNGGIAYSTFDDRLLYPSTMYNPAYGITPASSLVFKSQNQRFSYLLEPQLNYSHTFKDHQFDLLFGSTFQQTQNTALSILGYGFESNSLITNLSAAATTMVTGDLATEYRYAAFFGRLNYQYKGRYILNLTGRRDGSSRFGPDKRFADFGAIGAAWIISEESFLKDSRLLSYGKLRASYGVTGSDLIGDYQYLDTYTVSSTLYGGITSLYPSRLFNPYFSWEKTTKFEVAVDAGLLNDRIRITAAYYRNRSGNQLVGIPLPATTGFSSIQANLPAIVENTGLEIDLSSIPVQKGEFRWSSNINISFPRNRLVSFPGLEGSTYANKYVTGYPVSIVKVNNYQGIDQSTGLYTFTDYNADGLITSPEDNRIIKNIGTKYFGGWSNQFTYKNWDFSFLLQFVSQEQWNYNSIMPYPGTMNNQPEEVLNVWSEDNPSGRYMPYTTGVDPQKTPLLISFSNSTAAISDASFIRLKNVQLSYRLGFKKYVKDVLMYIQGQNLLTITDYFGLDPESSSIGSLPPLKTWSFGIKLTF